MIGRKDSKNSKGIMIIQIHNLSMKWTSIIVSKYFKLSNQPFDIKQEMLDSIKNDIFDGKGYSCETHITSLIKLNYERFQEARQAIIFPILLIWISMKITSSIGEVAFTITMPPTMKQF